MLTAYEKFRLVDKLGKNNLIAEVNWNTNDPETNECKVIRFTFPDGEQCFVDKNLLIQLLFVLGTPKEQQNMMPVELTRKRWYETTLGVKATKNIAKGEMMNFAIKIPLPDLKDEVIGELKRDFLKEGKVYLPKT